VACPTTPKLALFGALLGGASGTYFSTIKLDNFLKEQISIAELEAK
jgi:hypothetical protein